MIVLISNILSNLPQKEKCLCLQDTYQNILARMSIFNVSDNLKP